MRCRSWWILNEVSAILRRRKVPLGWLARGVPFITGIIAALISFVSIYLVRAGFVAAGIVAFVALLLLGFGLYKWDMRIRFKEHSTIWLTYSHERTRWLEHHGSELVIAVIAAAISAVVTVALTVGLGLSKAP